MTHSATARAHALLLALAALASACGTSIQYFRPAENAVAESAAGFPAASYQLALGGVRWGEIRVWSEGASYVGNNDAAVLRVSLEIENATDQVFELDVARTRLEAARLGERELAPVEPALLQGEATAPEHAVRQLDLEFPLPADTDLGELRSFRVHWFLRGPDGAVYEQHTPFLRQRSGRPRYYYSDFYWHDPYWTFGYPYRSWFGFGRYCY